MKVVIAPDSFKGSLTALKAAQAMGRGIVSVHPDWDIRFMPMADGGEGTLSCLVDATKGRYASAIVEDARGRKVEASFGLLGDGVTCVVELANACGLPQLEEDARNPLVTSTYGFGQLIRAGLDAGARRFLLCLGGSATNDGGIGMLQALGYGILNKDGEQVGRGGVALFDISRVDAAAADSRIAECEWIAACDVNNPLLGPNGASAVFGPQKGATPPMIEQLEAGMAKWAEVMAEGTGRSVGELPGGGAAGGVGASLIAMLGAELQPGVSICIELSGLEQELADADLVLTGEGRIDGQTLRGKAPFGVADLARGHGIPVILVGGSISLDPEEMAEFLTTFNVIGVAGLLDDSCTVEEAIAEAENRLEKRVERLFREELRPECLLRMPNYMIFNHVPVTFNFMLYVNRIYATEANRINPFSFRELMPLGLIDQQDYKESFSYLWNFFISYYENVTQNNSENYHLYDSDVNAHFEKFKILFQRNEQGEATFRLVWSFFISWWWLPYCGGKSILEKESDHFLANYHLPKSLSQNYSIQVLFEAVPEGLKSKGKNFHFVSLAKLERDEEGVAADLISYL